MKHPEDQERDRRSHAEERRRQFEASRGLDDPREGELDLDLDVDEPVEPPSDEEERES